MIGIPEEIVCPMFNADKWRAEGRLHSEDKASEEFPIAADDGSHRLMRTKTTPGRCFLVCRCGCEFSTDPSELSNDWVKCVEIS